MMSAMFGAVAVAVCWQHSLTMMVMGEEVEPLPSLFMTLTLSKSHDISGGIIHSQLNLDGIQSDVLHTTQTYS